APSCCPSFKSSDCVARVEPSDQAGIILAVPIRRATPDSLWSSIRPGHRRDDSMAILPPSRAGNHASVGAANNRRRVVWSPDELDESRRRAAVDALARAGNGGASDRRQFFLHDLPVHADARPRAPLPARAIALAEAIAVEVARSRIACG